MTEFDAAGRQIYHQGFLDGSCFLYSLANAYKALTGSKVTREKWDLAIQHVPEPANFLRDVGATGLSYQDAVALIEAMLDGFSEPGERFEIHQLSASAGIGDLCREISPGSVVNFAFSGKTEVHHPRNHVVCAVAASLDPPVLHLACSAAFSSRHLQDGSYEERCHPLLGRYSNDSIALDSPVEIAPNWRWRLTLVSGRTG
ncbi:MAG TPA: hypothetical protein VNE62_03370 [Actinomycetota bacterium]|nr:hypothetical protein [Actinomycetota bacterium]